MRIHYIYTLLAALLLLSSCGRSKTADGVEKTTIAVSIAPLESIVKSIAGDECEVITLLDKGANPETFDPSMSKRAAAEKSNIYLTLNVFPFEKSVVGKRGGSVDVSTGIERLYDSHGHSHGAEGECHHESDPHIWTSAKNMKIIAKNIGEAMIKLNPENAQLYQFRLDSLTRVIDSLDERLTDKLANVDTKAFVIWHPSLGYISKDYGLNQISVGEESKEISPIKLKETINRAIGERVKVFFFQKEFDSRQAYSINEELGARMVTIDPLDEKWMNQLEMIADELSK